MSHLRLAVLARRRRLQGEPVRAEDHVLARGDDGLAVRRLAEGPQPSRGGGSDSRQIVVRSSCACTQRRLRACRGLSWNVCDKQVTGVCAQPWNS